MTMGGGVPSGSMSMGMPSGSMTGNPPTGTMMGGGASATAVGGGTSSEPDTGDDEEGYGSHTPVYNTTFLRGWQYTDANGMPSVEIADADFRYYQAQDDIPGMVSRSSIAYPHESIHWSNSPRKRNIHQRSQYPYRSTVLQRSSPIFSVQD
jgi:hypothetical protein